VNASRGCLVILQLYHGVCVQEGGKEGKCRSGDKHSDKTVTQPCCFQFGNRGL
jgi:hypothetical protein